MTNPAKIPEFNFNEWSDLAINDPEAFEKKRQQAIEDTILSMPARRQQRLRCLQWRIDQERNRCKTSIAACIKLSGMMWDQVVGDHGLLHNIKMLENPAKPMLSMPGNNLLAFPAPSP
ncbi:MAG: DUF3135 domain-containing protein [Gammaproteobacteria bacterium]|nr:DUF3135 domain-containing protein [Gammaproteobacteria bacterium]